MKQYFNTYYENIDTDFWHNLCVEKGVLRQYDKGELFAKEGRTAKYLGYIKTGSPRITEIASYGNIASYLNISRRQLQRIREIYQRALTQNI